MNFENYGKTHSEITMWIAAQYIERVKDFIQLFGLDKAIDQIYMIRWLRQAVHLYISRREDGHVLRMALRLQVECHLMKEIQRKT